MEERRDWNPAVRPSGRERGYGRVYAAFLLTAGRKEIGLEGGPSKDMPVEVGVVCLRPRAEGAKKINFKEARSCFLFFGTGKGL
jgi:hypothetical protein